MDLDNQSSCDVRVARFHRSAASLIAVVIWLAVVVTGVWWLWGYEHTSGLAYEAPRQWPVASELARTSHQPTLVFFAHPKCPCTRASIEELSRLMTACRGRVSAHAVFVKPDGCAEQQSWQATDLWRSAARIPGVITHLDIGGREAVRFGAATSGWILLYAPNGELWFEGGITSSRGHSGDNLGRTAITNLIHSGSAQVATTKVYGCQLGVSGHDTATTCCSNTP